MGLSAGAAAQSMSKEIMQNSEDTKICPNCDSELKRSSKFCSECGYKFAVKKFCPNCGSEINSEARFCDNCGFKQ